ncbi:MAG: DNA polymerase I [Clostridia bacterium]|nr:DNA polymerase I [Clostridia bacterium]
MKKILIVDGNSILNRAFYGVRPLTTKDGLHTNAVYGMYTILTKNINLVKPDYCVVAFDLKAPTFRHKMYDGYKANRHGMPEELAVQLPYAKECMRDMGFTVLELEGYEADDILGTVSDKASREGVRSYLLTGDRDSLQLINDDVTVLLTTNKETVNFDRRHFTETYGIDPSQFADVKALMGDSSDNIPGVLGIGEKTAFKLISDFGSLDGVYEKYMESKLSPSVKQKLEAGSESAKLSKKLVTIDKDAPIDFDLSAYEYNGIKKPELKALFEKLEFFAFIKKLGLDAVQTVSAEPQSTEEKANEQSQREEADEVCFDRVSAVYVSDGKLTVYDGKDTAVYDLDISNKEAIEKLFRSEKTITHNSKELYKALIRADIECISCCFDTMLAAYVLNSSRRGYSLPEVYLEYSGKSLGEDISAPAAVYSLYRPMLTEIKNIGAEHLLFDVELPLALVLADMEITGIKIDTDGITEYGNELAELESVLKERIYCAAGEEFNIDSTKQLGNILFDKLGLPVQKKTKTGYSTDAEVLGKLRGKHDIIEDILDYRQVSKLRSTYTDGLVRLADENGRIHTVLNQTGTATGRLSSSEPNLQNIPVRTELGSRFRRYFVPKNEDYVIIDADYSQIELRLLADVSGDETMISAFADGADIHTSTAAKVFEVDEREVTPDLRKRAKAVNFGIMYGMGEYSLSEDLGISRAQAKKYIDSYLEGFPKVNEYRENIKEQAKRDGYVSTLFGRRRYIPELSASNKNIRNFGERVAMNSPIQGTAADIIKIAMINTHKKLIEAGIDAKLILQIHDELLIEAHRDCAEAAKEILVFEMENAVKLGVPLDVEANAGENWLEAK